MPSGIYGNASYSNFHSYGIVPHGPPAITDPLTYYTIPTGLFDWWDDSWKYRRQLTTVLLPSGGPYTSGIHYFNFTLNLQLLTSLNKVRSDYLDVRVIFTSGSPTTYRQVPYYIASGCSPCKIYCQAQNHIPANINISDQDWSYWVYYGNIRGNIEKPPPIYKNYNFPQAPYSVTISAYNGEAYRKFPPGMIIESGFFDKFLFKLNDDPATGSASGFNDSTAHTSGISAPYVTNCVTKEHEGRLDTCSYFTDSSKGNLKVYYKDNITHPSGSFNFDSWIKIDNTQNIRYLFTRYRDDGSVLLQSFIDQRDIHCRYYYDGSSYVHIKEDDAIDYNEWTHLRFSYRTNLDDDSKLTIYKNGAVISTSGAAIKTTASSMYGDSGGLCLIGNINSTTNGFKGYLEQVRFSNYPEFASGVDYKYIVRPDWVSDEYTVELGPETYRGSYIDVDGNPHAFLGGYLYCTPPQSICSGIIGGYLIGEVQNATSGIIGGWLLSDASGHTPFIVGGYFMAGAPYTHTPIGGYLDALPLTSMSSGVGGYVFSLAGEANASIGGAMVGTWFLDNYTCIENLSRALVKAVDDQTHKQTFSTDAQFTIYATNQDEFDSKIIINREEDENFDAEVSITKYKKNPHIEILDTIITGTGPWTVIVQASGYVFDRNNQIIESGIQKANIVWTDGYFTEFTNTTVSGSYFEASHVYSQSGLYKPIINIYDKMQYLGSAYTEVNLASGQYPFIELSGTPRSGIATLDVDFTVNLSGIVGNYSIYWDLGNGLIENSKRTTKETSYIIPGDYTPYVRLMDSRNVPVVDTLLIGWNL